MRLYVLPLPQAPLEVAGQVCLVVDVIRATTTAITLFDAGCRRLYLTRRRDDAAWLRQTLGSDAILCAEANSGALAPGFDHEPSPVLLSRLDLTGREVALATANGTPAALAAWRGEARIVLLAALSNLSAATRAAAQVAGETGADITILCSGRLRNARIALEDVYCAGMIVQRLTSIAADASWPLDLDDSALLAAQLANSYPAPAAALAASATGRHFTRTGRGEDVAWCARVDTSARVPIVVADGGNHACPVEVLDE